MILWNEQNKTRVGIITDRELFFWSGIWQQKKPHVSCQGIHEPACLNCVSITWLQTQAPVFRFCHKGSGLIHSPLSPLFLKDH